MGRRPVRVVSINIAFMTAAVGLWGAAAATTWGNLDAGRGLTVEAVGAGTATLLAWLAWQARRQERRDQERKRADRDRTILIRTLADAVPARAIARTTIPFRRAL